MSKRTLQWGRSSQILFYPSASHSTFRALPSFPRSILQWRSRLRYPERDQRSNVNDWFSLSPSASTPTECSSSMWLRCLRKLYFINGISLWLTSPHENLSSERPKELSIQGHTPRLQALEKTSDSRYLQITFELNWTFLGRIHMGLKGHEHAETEETMWMRSAMWSRGELSG